MPTPPRPMATRAKRPPARGAAAKSPARPTTPRRAAATAQSTKKAKASAKTSPRRGASPAPAPPAAAARKAATRALKTGSPAWLERSLDLYRALLAAHPDAHCELDHKSPFQLVVATVLSAQATDVQVNLVTPALFAAYPTPEKLATAEQADVEALIGRLGMFRQKAKNIIGLARGLVSDHAGQVPRSLAALVALPGVGRKTANVVLGVAFNSPEGVVVDTHVGRLAQRLGFSENSAPEKVEQDLMALLPREEWDRASHTLIFHGRRICSARKPACSTCPVNATCPSAFHAEDIGRKPPRLRA